MPPDLEFDAIVLGAGPAGTTVAALLAEKGHRVALIEREPLPRYRIGESLIPHCWYALERLGLVQRVDSAGFVVRKFSVQFVSTDGRRSMPFYFNRHTDHDCSRTWQVSRAEFDALLLENALEKGARLYPFTAAKELVAQGSQVVGVRAVREDGAVLELRAPVTVDATGRDALAQTRNGWRVKDPSLNKIALWTYYEGSVRDEGIDEGATTIAYLPQRGWFWHIPMAHDRVSVGIVAEADYLYRDVRDRERIFLREVERQPWIRERLAPGKRVAELRTTGDFSYRSKHCATSGLVLVGDAFAFLDPVFSSGVYFALQSGVMAADAVHAAVEAGDASAARFLDYGRRFCRQIEPMRRLVYAFYDSAFHFGTFLRNHPEFHRDMTDCLTGNLDRDFGPFFAAIARYASVPEPLSHGLPTGSGRRELERGSAEAS